VSTPDGRAGRKTALDPYGEAVLLAKDAPSIERLFETFINAEPERIDSQCADDDSFSAHILSLIATGFAHDEDALASLWSGPFTFTSIQRRVHSYGLSLMLCSFLRMAGMITIHQGKISATPLGSLVSRLYLSPCTAHLILQTLSNCQAPTLIGLLHVICVSPDMQRLYLRSSDNQLLRNFIFAHTADLSCHLPMTKKKKNAGSQVLRPLWSWPIGLMSFQKQ
jgi:helicase